MIRIAFIVHTFDMGGLERCVSRLANHLDASQFAPAIVCVNRNGTAAGWLQRETPIFELNKKPGRDPGIVRRMADLFASERFDIVHSHNWGTLVETSRARRRAGVPVHVHAERGMELADRTASFIKRKLRNMAARWTFGHVDSLLAVAEAVKNDVIHRTGIRGERIRVVPNGVDPFPECDARDRVRKSIGVSDEAIVLGSVGRLAPVKDFGTAIEALGQLRESDQRYQLVLVGDGPERDALEALAEQRGLASVVHFPGRSDVVHEWLNAFDIYLNCSLNEGMSQSIIEAMAVGLPLVVSDVGDNAILAGGSGACGLVVPPACPSSLAAAIGKMEKDNVRTRFSTNARQRFKETYSVTRMTEIYERLYRELAARN